MTRAARHESDPVVREVVVDAAPGRAFEAFLDEIAAWWPAVFTFAGDDLASVVVDGPGGRWYERDRAGAERDWGEIRAWEPPRRAVLAWRVGADRGQEPPERASEVEVRFTALDDDGPGPRTRVVVRHDDFGRHGEGAEAMRAGMASAQGWEGLLEAYRDHLRDA